MKIVFMGTPDFAVEILMGLIESEHQVVGVVSQPDRMVGRKRILTPTPVKLCAIAHEIPVFQPEKIKLNFDLILEWKPDLIVTCAYGQIIPSALLECAPYGAINVHASLLPKLRGGAPIHRAIMEGHTKTGITIMFMSAKMDAGDLIAQSETPILHNDSLGTLSKRLSGLGRECLLSTLPAIFSGNVIRFPQDESLVTYGYNIRPEEEKIDWTNEGETIYNLIRGLYPEPGAYTTLEESRIKILGAEQVVRIHNTPPGEIIRVYQDAILVTTGDESCIKITEIQLAGKTRQKMKDCLNGTHPFAIGKQFK